MRESRHRRRGEQEVGNGQRRGCIKDVDEHEWKRSGRNQGGNDRGGDTGTTVRTTLLESDSEEYNETKTPNKIVEENYGGGEGRREQK